MTRSPSVALSLCHSPLRREPPADSPADPAADPASNLTIGDPPAPIPTGHGGLRVHVNVADSQAVMR
jgi:hypothetical protein